MDRMFTPPQNYAEWLHIFEILRSSSPEPGWEEILAAGCCPGVERIMPDACRRVQDTVSAVLKRTTGHCTRLLNEALEEGDFSNIGVVLGRSFRQMEAARFYLHMNFLPADYKEQLDRETLRVMESYREQIRHYLRELAEEKRSAELEDLLYELRRI